MGDERNERVDQLQYFRDYTTVAQTNVLKSACLATETRNITSANYVAKQIFGMVNSVLALLDQPGFNNLLTSSVRHRWGDWAEKAFETSCAVRGFVVAHGIVTGESGAPAVDGAPMDQALDSGVHGGAHGDSPGQGDDEQLTEPAPTDQALDSDVHGGVHGGVHGDSPGQGADELSMEPAAVNARAHTALGLLATAVDEHLAVLRGPNADHVPAASAVVAALVVANRCLLNQPPEPGAEPLAPEVQLRAVQQSVATMASLASIIFVNIHQTIDAALLIASLDGEGAGGMQVDVPPLPSAVPVGQLSEALLSSLDDARAVCTAARSRVDAGLEHAVNEAARWAEAAKILADSWSNGTSAGPGDQPLNVGSVDDLERAAATVVIEEAAARHNQAAADALSDAASNQTAYLGRLPAKSAVFSLTTTHQFSSCDEQGMLNDIAAQVNLVNDLEIPLWGLFKQEITTLLEPLYPHYHPDFVGNSGSRVTFSLLRNFLPQYFEDKPEDDTAAASDQTGGDGDYKPPTAANSSAQAFDRLVYGSLRAAILNVATKDYGLEGVSIPNYTNSNYVPVDESFCKALPDPIRAVVGMIDLKLARYELPLYAKEHRALSQIKNQLQNGQVTVVDLLKQDSFRRFQLQAPADRVTYTAMNRDGIHPLTTYEQLTTALVDASGIYTPGHPFFILVDKIAKVAKIDEKWLEDAVKNGLAYVEAISLEYKRRRFFEEAG